MSCYMVLLHEPSTAIVNYAALSAITCSEASLPPRHYDDDI